MAREKKIWNLINELKIKSRARGKKKELSYRKRRKQGTVESHNHRNAKDFGERHAVEGVGNKNGKKV